MPEWFFGGLTIGIGIAALVAFGVGYYLEMRYTGPYTLLAASSETRRSYPYSRFLNFQIKIVVARYLHNYSDCPCTHYTFYGFFLPDLLFIQPDQF